MTTYFISGHLDLTQQEFEEHYAPKIRAAIEHGASFVVGDARGADKIAQEFIAKQYIAKPCCISWQRHVTCYHMRKRPRNCAGFPTSGGFKSDDERDAAMTAASDVDIAWVRPGGETSGTAKNLARRVLRIQLDEKLPKIVA